MRKFKYRIKNKHMTFVNPADLVAHLEFGRGSIGADFGCGAGYFCIPAARMTGKEGTVYAIDIMPPRLEATASNARHAGLSNVVTVQADLEKPLSGVPHTSCDWVIAGNIIHQVQDRHNLLNNVYRLLKTGGKFLVVEWKNGDTLFGPPQDNRVNLSDLVVLCERMGLRHEKNLPSDTSHYAAVFVK